MNTCLEEANTCRASHILAELMGSDAWVQSTVPLMLLFSASSAGCRWKGIRSPFHEQHRGHTDFQVRHTITDTEEWFMEDDSGKCCSVNVHKKYGSRSSVPEQALLGWASHNFCLFVISVFLML